VGNKNSIILILEAAISGFYLAVSRSLAPLYLVSQGLKVQELLLLSALGNLLAVLTIRSLYSLLQSRGISARTLLLVHGIERVLWCSIPYLGMLGLIGYLAGITVATMTGFLITLLIMGLGNEELVKKVMSRRTALSATTSVVAQVLATLALAGGAEIRELLLTALGIGLLATVVLSRMHLDKLRSKPSTAPASEALEKQATVFLYLLFLLASSSILSISWPSYLLKILSVHTWVASLLSTVQTLTTIVAAFVWVRVGFKSYRIAIALLPLVPLAAFLIRDPYMHILLASANVLLFSGANYFGGFMYARLAYYLGPIRASLFLISASGMAQVVGPLISYLAMLQLGVDALFIVSSALALVSLIIAMTSISEVALAPEKYVRIYSRILYNASIASYTTMIIAARSALTLTLQLLALSSTAMLLFLFLKMAYYIALLSGG